MTIEEIFAGESKNVEFKENLPEKSIKYMKSVVAFANGTGGKIIFGIADKTREVVGFAKEDVFEKMDAIANAVSDSCEPAIGYTGALKAPVRCFGNHLSGQRKSQFRTDNECGGAAILKDRTSRMVSLIGC